MIYSKQQWKRIEKICKDRKSHYDRYFIPKRSGGKREILAPSDELKNLQELLLNKFLYARFIPSVYATGFIVDRSIVHNARAHVGAAILVNVDVKNFFPSITADMLGKDVFLDKLYSVEHNKIQQDIIRSGKRMWEIEPKDIEKKINKKDITKKANLLTKLVTYPYKKKDALPQGAPTSPALSNIVCFEMDNMMSGLAKRNDAVYTRYADDLTFSSSKNKKLNRIIPVIKDLLKKYNFKANERKIHVNRQSGRMQVTGLVVNDKVSYGRGRWRIIRAALHNAKMKICNDKELVPFDVMHYRGMAAYLNSFDKNKAEHINNEVDQIVDGIRELKRSG